MIRAFSNGKQILRLVLIGMMSLIAHGSVKAQEVIPVHQLIAPCERYIRIDRQTQTSNAQNAEVVSFSVKFSNGEETGSTVWEPSRRYYKINTNRLDQEQAAATATVTLTIQSGPSGQGESSTRTVSQFVTFNASSCMPGTSSGTRMVADDSNSDTRRLSLLLTATVQGGQEVKTGSTELSVAVCPAKIKLDGKMTGAPEFAGQTLYYAIVSRTLGNSTSLTPDQPLPEYFKLTFPTPLPVNPNNPNNPNARIAQQQPQPVSAPIAGTNWTLKPRFPNMTSTGWLSVHFIGRNSDGTFKRKADGTFELGLAFAQVKVECGKITRTNLPGEVKVPVKASGDKKPEKSNNNE